MRTGMDFAYRFELLRFELKKELRGPTQRKGLGKKRTEMEKLAMEKFNWSGARR